MARNRTRHDAAAGWTRLGTLPAAAFTLVALNGLYLALVAFGNITDFDTNWAFVQHVLAMDTTNFGAPEGTNLDPDVMWRAIGNETIQRSVYLAIIAWEAVTAALLLTAVVIAIRERRRDDGYRKARSLATIGLAMLVLLFFGGFIVIGGEWFQMWKSSAWNGLDPAFRNSVLALLTLVLLHLPSPHWAPPQTDA
jgi:predicted small integral membrane protein